MAVVVYYMLCRDTDGLILDVAQADTFSSQISGATSKSAMFSADPGDDPDVLMVKPYHGDLFTEDPITYTPQVGGCIKPFLKVRDWSGPDGAADPDDGVWELSDPDGVKSFTLTVKKWEEVSDTAIEEAGDIFEVSVLGGKCPCGRVTLDANGEATITFVPLSGEYGGATVILRPINSSAQYRVEASQFRVVSSS